MAAVRSNPEALEFVRSELRVKTAVAIAEKALADNDEPPGERAEEVCSSAFETQISALPPDIREDFDFVAGVLLCLRDALNRGKRMPWLALRVDVMHVSLWKLPDTRLLHFDGMIQRRLLAAASLLAGALDVAGGAQAPRRETQPGQFIDNESLTITVTLAFEVGRVEHAWRSGCTPLGKAASVRVMRERCALCRALLGVCGCALEFFPELQSDRQAVMAALSNSATALQFASKELASDAAVMQAGLEVDALGALEWGGTEVRDRDLMMKAIQSNPLAIRHCRHMGSERADLVDVEMVLLAAKVATEAPHPVSVTQELAPLIKWSLFQTGASCQPSGRLLAQAIDVECTHALLIRINHQVKVNVFKLNQSLLPVQATQLLKLVEANPQLLPFALSERWNAAKKYEELGFFEALTQRALELDASALAHAEPNDVACDILMRFPVGRFWGLQMLRKDGKILRRLHSHGSSLLDNKDAVLAAVRNRGEVLIYASQRLRDDAEVVNAALDSDASALKHASDALRNDRDVVLKAVSTFGLVLVHASDALRADREIVEVAVRQSGEAIECATEDFRNDRDLVMLAVKHANEDQLHRWLSGCVLMGGRFWSDRELVLAAVRRDGRLLEFAASLRTCDREVCLAAIAQAPSAIEFVAPDLQHRLVQVRSDTCKLSLQTRLELIRAKMELTQRRAAYMREFTGSGHDFLLDDGARSPLHLVIGDMGDHAALVESVLAQVEALPVSELRFCELEVHFEGHAGSDAGGLTRELFNAFTQGLLHAPAIPPPSDDVDAPRGVPLFRLTPTDALVPWSAEAIMDSVSSWSNPHSDQPPVPTICQAELARYKAAGRLAGVALAHKQTFGTPLALHFLSMVLDRPPSTLAELQAAQRSEVGANLPTIELTVLRLQQDTFAPRSSPASRFSPAIPSRWCSPLAGEGWSRAQPRCGAHAARFSRKASRAARAGRAAFISAADQHSCSRTGRQRGGNPSRAAAGSPRF